MTTATGGHADVVVVGSGPAGCAVAIRLAQLGRTVVVVERSRLIEPKLAEHLPPSVRPVLRDLGVAEPTQGESKGVTISWGGTGIRYSDYLFDPYGHGYHVDRGAFDAQLATVLSRTTGVVMRPTCTQPVARHNAHGWTVTLQESAGPTASLTAQFLVDATGRSAAMARSRGSRRRRFDRLVAVAARYALPAAGPAPTDRLVVESVETGWWYAIAMPTGQTVVVFVTDVHAIRERSSSVRHLWRSELAQTTLIRGLLPPLGDPPSVVVRSVEASILEPMHGLGWVAVGEAGVACDPLYGRGVIDALESGSAAATAIDRALGGDYDALDAFAQQRVELFHRHLEERRETYGRELRWVTCPFWINRRTSSVPAELRIARGHYDPGIKSRDVTGNSEPPDSLRTGGLK